MKSRRRKGERRRAKKRATMNSRPTVCCGADIAYSTVMFSKTTRLNEPHSCKLNVGL